MVDRAPPLTQPLYVEWMCPSGPAPSVVMSDSALERLHSGVRRARNRQRGQPLAWEGRPGADAR